MKRVKKNDVSVKKKPDVKKEVSGFKPGPEPAPKAQKELNLELMDSAEKGDFEKAKELIDKGADIFFKDGFGWSPLMKALEHAKDPHAGIFEAGAPSGIFVLANTEGREFAPGEGHIEIAKLLIDMGAGADAIFYLRETNALDRLRFKGSIIEKKLVEKKAYFNDLLREYAQFAYKEGVEEMLEKGADVNSKDFHRDTALIKTAWRGDNEIARLLIEKGADINARNDEGKTALTIAARMGKTEMVKLLIEKGVDVNAVTKDGETALTIAASFGHTETFRVLSEKTEVDVESDAVKWALRWAVTLGRVEIAEFLIEKGVDVNSRFSGGRSIMDNAKDLGRNEILELIEQSRAE